MSISVLWGRGEAALAGFHFVEHSFPVCRAVQGKAAVPGPGTEQCWPQEAGASRCWLPLESGSATTAGLGGF